MLHSTHFDSHCLELFFNMVIYGAFGLFHFSHYLSNTYTHMQMHAHVHKHTPTLVSSFSDT